MNKLVSESLNEYINEEPVNELVINEAVDPQALQMLVGTISVLAASGGLAVMLKKIKESPNKTAKKFTAAMDAVGKVGKSLGSGIKGGSTSLGESQKINEALDPAMIELATIAGGTLLSTIAVGGTAVLIDKLQKSKNPTVIKFAKLLGAMGKGAASGATQKE